MDQQKGKTTPECDRGASHAIGGQDQQTGDEYSRQKDSEAPLPEERNNLVRNNNLYQHKQATTSDTKTEVASQHAQPQQKKGGTIVYQQKLTTISYTKPDNTTKPDTGERRAQPQQQKGGDIPVRRNDPESTLSDEENDRGSETRK